jgi:lipopolysaccharide/colanic/teichoic acid biosynthesis glycosyltransferase
MQEATFQTIPVKKNYLRAKRVLDITFTLIILFPLCIVVVIVGILIRLDSRGPIFFRQKRVGLNGTEFTMLKFRSMYVDSNDTIHRDVFKHYFNGEVLNSKDGESLSYKLVDDPRITRVGRFIRKTSIDELPQFFNVLAGAMTIVGPRPPLPYEVALYQSRDRLRLAGKPGITGYWQVYGRSKVTFQEMVQMDIAYLQRQSSWEDLKLIALTVLVMIKKDGGA